MEKVIIRRDKEKTKQKLISAVGKILRKEGFHAVKINKVAETAGVGKKLIYNYFKNIDGLIKAYLNQVDFWAIEKEKSGQNESAQNLTKEKVLDILKGDFTYLRNSVEMQKIILWGISEKNKTIRAITDEREQYGKELFQLSDKTFENTSVDFRAINSIFVSAIYYMVLHAKTNGSTICEIDITNDEGVERIFKAMSQILDWCYKET